MRIYIGIYLDVFEFATRKLKFWANFSDKKIGNKQILPITFKEASKEYGENRRTMIFRSSRIEILRPLKWGADTPSIQQVSAQRLWVGAQAVVDRKD